MTRLRTLTADGVAAFEEYLVSPSRPVDPPHHLLEDSRFSERFADVEVPVRRFTSKLDLARTIDSTIREELRHALAGNTGIWSWLALLYFDQLAPIQEGRRVVKSVHRYVYSADYRHRYRHLIAGPYYTYRNHGEFSRLILHPEVHTHGDFAEQLAARSDLLTNPGVVRALDALYFDAVRGKPKKGGTNRKRGGTLRRFITVLQQLERTFDLQGMSADELLALLPREFDPWVDVPR